MDLIASRKRWEEVMSRLKTPYQQTSADSRAAITHMIREDMKIEAVRHIGGLRGMAPSTPIPVFLPKPSAAVVNEIMAELGPERKPNRRNKTRR